MLTNEKIAEMRESYALASFEYARAIEAAAIAPLLERIAELESQLTAAAKDAERLNHLDKNIHSREPDLWDSRFGACKDGDTWCWVMFAPKDVQGSARLILDAAIARTKEQP